MDSGEDSTAGQFTTVKVQALLDARTNPDVGNRRDLAAALSALGAVITIHGVDAWFRRVDSNYKHPRQSLSASAPSFLIPGKHWPLLLEVFDIPPAALDRSDERFSRSALSGELNPATSSGVHREKSSKVRAINLSSANHLPGRETALSTLLGALERSETAGASMVFLEGAAGLGKTALVEELVRRTRASGRTCLTASCVENAYVPLLPLLDLVRLQADEIARGGTVAQKLAHELLQRIEQANQALAFIDSSTAMPVEMTDARSALFLLGSDLLVALARHSPLLVVVDDVHWLDTTTRDLLSHFARFLRLNRGHRVLLVLVGREFSRELLHQLPTGDFVRRVTLSPLGRGAMKRAISHRLEHELNPPALDYVWSITRGNPLYVEQLCEHLVASNQLELHKGRFALVAPVDAIHVPDTLDDYYRRRFDALKPDSAKLLQLASCLGQSVDADFLSLLMPDLKTAALLSALDEGEGQGLLRFSNLTYEFCHPVARHAVYMAMTDAQRSQQHALVAIAIRQALPEPNPHASIELAYHLVRGQPFTNSLDTLHACREAANHSHRLAAWPSAEYFATNALELDGRKRGDGQGELSDAQRGVLLRLRGSSRHLTARPEVALQDLSLALERFQSAQNTEEYTRTLSQIVRIRSNFFEVSEGSAEAAQALGEHVELLGGASNETAASALEVLASYRLANNDSREAQRLAERVISGDRDSKESTNPATNAQRTARTLDLSAPESVAFASITAGLASLNHLEVQPALGYLMGATRWSRENNNQQTLIRSLQRMIVAQFVMGRIDDAVVTFSELESLGGATVTGEHSAACSAMSAALAVTGKFETSFALAEDGLELVDVTGYRFMETALVGNQVFDLLQMGSFDAADQAIARLEETRPRRVATLMRHCLALASDRSNLEPLPEPIRLSAQTDRAPDVGELARVSMLTELALAQGDKDVLLGLLPKLQMADRNGVAFAMAWPVQIPLLLARLHLSLGNERDAHHYFRKSLDFGSANGLGTQLQITQLAVQTEWPDERELNIDARLALERELLS